MAPLNLPTNILAVAFLTPCLLFPVLLIRLVLLARSNCCRRRSLISSNDDGSVAVAPPTLPSSSTQTSQDSTVLVVLGSGGHTAEMLTMVSDILRSAEASDAVSEIVYVVGATDTHSAQKVTSLHLALEEEQSQKQEQPIENESRDSDTDRFRSERREGDMKAVNDDPLSNKAETNVKAAAKAEHEKEKGIQAHSTESQPQHRQRPKRKKQQVCMSFRILPRAREVGQSFLSSIPSALRTTIAALRLVATLRPAIVLANGPANSAVLAAAAFLVRATFAPKSCRVIYVESFARVKSLSLSGKIVYWFADRFIVQWEPVHRAYPISEFYGRVC